MKRVKRRREVHAAGEAAADYLRALGANPLEAVPEDELAAWRERRDAEHRAELEAEEAERRGRLEAAAEQKRLKALAEAGVPLKDLRLFAEGGARSTEPLMAAQAFYRSGSVLLALAGAKGVGKTAAASWWAMQPHPGNGVHEPRPVRMLDAHELARIDRFDQEAMCALEMATGLVIDELGGEFLDTKGAFRSLVNGLINKRYANALPTVVTANLTLADFAARYGERLVDRWREIGEFYEFQGESLRGGSR